MTALRPDYSGEWRIDPSKTRIGFSIRHAMFMKVRGAFNEFEGVIMANAEDPSRSSIRLNIQVASIDTRNADRDQHLRTNDFFDAPNFPEIIFASTCVDHVDRGHYVVSGDVTIRGVTKEIALPMDLLRVERDPMGKLRAGFEGSRRIDRQDFGLKWETALDSGRVLGSDKIILEFEVSAIKVEDGAGAPQV